MNSDFNSNNKSKLGVFTQIFELLDEISFFVRFILIINVILIILNIFIPHISFYLSNIPALTIKQYQFWRLITTSFITTNLINMIFGFIVWIKDAISLEKSLGTIRYIFIFIFNSIFINLLSCFLTFLFSSNSFELSQYSYIHKVNNSGIWPIIICEMTLLCFNNPDSKIKFLFVPSPIRAKYYPFIIIILLMLINNFRISFEIISGFLYGIIYYYLLQNKFSISEETSKRLENSWIFRCLIGLHGFMIINKVHQIMNAAKVNIESSFERNGNFQEKEMGHITSSNQDYMAVNDQNNNNVHTLEEINANSNNNN
jgi:membrane associated rhomboid family serine protease